MRPATLLALAITPLLLATGRDTAEIRPKAAISLMVVPTQAR